MVRKYGDTERAKKRFRYLPVKRRLSLKIRNKFNEPENSAEYDKLVLFRDYQQNMINLEIQLKTDCITRSEFFRAAIQGYLEREPNIVNFVENYIKKETKSRTPEFYDKVLKKEEEEHNKTVKSFFTEEEVESIFDLIAQEMEE
jgi:hypothetical protein